MQLKWKTIKIDKDSLAHLAFKEIDGAAPGKGTKDPDKEVHPDFMNAMQKLKPHFALLCEQLETPSNINSFTAEELENFTVRGFHRGKNDEIPGVTIVGSKVLKSGKYLGLNAPFTRFYEDPSHESAYPFQEHLEGILGEIEVEAEEYLNGKFQPEQQPELPFGQPNGDTSKTTVAVLEPEEGSAFDEKPKGKGKKKAVVTD